MVEARTAAPAIVLSASGPAIKLDLVGIDAIRGLAAILVLFSHARHFVVQDYSTAPQGLVSTTFYALTGLGHQAVIAFFVLSGFLISRSVVRAEESGNWSWRGYFTNRLARLWTVLIPCLVLTAALDLFTIELTRSSFYAGELNFYNSGPAGPVDLSPLALIGNILFLQTILVPVFGSNGPLWSLANEFWYYVAFPMIYFASPQRFRDLAFVSSAMAACVAGTLLDAQILQLWPAWLAGYYAQRAAVTVRAFSRVRTLGSFAVLAGLALIVILSAAASLLEGLVSDLLLAGAMAIVISALAHANSTDIATRLSSEWAARASYSLYVCHFPVLAAISAIALQNKRMPLGGESFGMFAALVVSALGAAVVVYYAVERHTDWTRRLLSAIGPR